MAVTATAPTVGGAGSNGEFDNAARAATLEAELAALGDPDGEDLVEFILNSAAAGDTAGVAARDKGTTPPAAAASTTAAMSPLPPPSPRKGGVAPPEATPGAFDFGDDDNNDDDDFEDPTDPRAAAGSSWLASLASHPEIASLDTSPKRDGDGLSDDVEEAWRRSVVGGGSGWADEDSDSASV